MTTATIDLTRELAENRLITGDEPYELVGVEPCELIDGRMVPMSPTGGEHGAIETYLSYKGERTFEHINTRFRSSAVQIALLHHQCDGSRF